MTETLTPPPAPAPPRAEHRFFAWMRGRGIPRRQGWVGGVCAGLATRMGIDPLIVRGIFVVAALIGLPALLIYALAWALLPDEHGRIHLENAVRGDFDPAMVAILVATLLGLVPVVPLILFSSWIETFLHLAPLVIFVLVLVALVAWAVTALSRRGSRRRAASRHMDAVAPTSPEPSMSPGPEAATAATDAAMPTPGTMPAPAPGTIADFAPPPADAAQWRDQQQLWREQHDAWRRAQADNDRVVREQARAEREAAGAAFAAESAARRLERRTNNPRVSGAFTLAIIGSALVLGTSTGLFSLNGALGAYALAIGFLVAAATVAVGMIIAGLLRRRSGFLAFLTTVLLLFGLTAPALASDRVFLLGSTRVDNPTATSFVQPWATFQLNLNPYVVAPVADGIELIKGSGWTYVIVEPGIELQLRARVGDVTLITQRGDWGGEEPLLEERERVQSESGTLRTLNRTFVSGTPFESDVLTSRTITLDLEQRRGEITVIVVEPAPTAPAPTDDAPTDPATEETSE